MPWRSSRARETASPGPPGCPPGSAGPCGCPCSCRGGATAVPLSNARRRVPVRWSTDGSLLDRRPDVADRDDEQDDGEDEGDRRGDAVLGRLGERPEVLIKAEVELVPVAGRAGDD